MNDDDRQRLIDELWPTPAPPPDLAARVLAQMAAKPAALRSSHRRRWLLAGAAVSAAATFAVIWWRGGTETGARLAEARTTVDIGGRAAAALEPGAELAWSVRRRRAHVQQRRGSVFYRVEHGGPFEVDTPAGAIEVTGTCFRVALDRADTTLVSVMEGSVIVSSGDGRLRLQPGEAARLAKGRAPEPLATPDTDAPLPKDPGARALDERLRTLEQELAEARAQAPRAPAPTPSPLLLPASTRLEVHGNSLDEVSLAIPARARGKRVEVARDAAFEQRIFGGVARAGFVTVAAPGGRGDLYWRAAGRPALLGHARFLADQRPALDDAAHNVVAEGRDRTTIEFQGAPPALTLTFAARPGAHGYRVRVFRAHEPARPIVDRIVHEPRCALAAGLLSEGRYTWTAAPVEGDAPASDRRNELDLVYDNALSGLAITRPRPGESLGNEVEVQGAASLGARLYINDHRVAVDEKGRFAMKVVAPHALVFRLVAHDGTERYWVRTGQTATRLSRR